MLEPYIQYRMRYGNPIPGPGYAIVPVTKTLVAQIPGMRGGAVWNRPISIHVITPEGNEAALPVVDVTRIIQLALLALGLTGAILIYFLKHRS